MEFLGDYGNLVQTEYGLGPYHGVQGPKSGIVQKNAFFRDSSLDQVPFKNDGFVIVGTAIIAAHQDIVYFSRFKERNGGIYPIGIIRIGPTADQPVGGS